MTATHITAPGAWEPSASQVMEWRDRHGLQGILRYSEARDAIDDARSLHMLAAAPEFGGVAVAYLIRHSDSPSFQHIIPAGEMDAKFHAALVADKTRSVSPLFAHPPAADEAMGRDAAMLDWLVREFEKHGAIDVRRYGPGKAGCLLFTVSFGLRASIAAAMRGGESGE